MLDLKLDALAPAEGGSSEKLLPLVYEELRKLASARLAHELPGQTLQTTALVHEAWLRITGTKEQHWANKRHFFAAAAEAMRRILVERARRRSRQRHGGGMKRVDVDEVNLSTDIPEDRLLALNEALEEFSREQPAKAEVVKLRYFAGLNNAQTAEMLALSVPTVERYWAFSKAWLYNRIRELG